LALWRGISSIRPPVACRRITTSSPSTSSPAIAEPRYSGLDVSDHGVQPLGLGAVFVMTIGVGEHDPVFAHTMKVTGL
jgi:hypothetical protein